VHLDEARKTLDESKELRRFAAEEYGKSSRIYETFKQVFAWPPERISIALWALERLGAFLGDNNYEPSSLIGKSITLSNPEIRQEIDNMIKGLEAFRDRIKEGKEI
jgi:hypothetical protein